MPRSSGGQIYTPAAHGLPATSVQRLVRGWLARRGATLLSTLRRLENFSDDWLHERRQLARARDDGEGRAAGGPRRGERWLLRVEKMPDGSPVHSDVSATLPMPTEVMCDRHLLDELLDFVDSPHLAPRAAELAYVSEELLFKQPRKLVVTLDLRAPRLLVPTDLTLPGPVLALDMGHLVAMRAAEPVADDAAASSSSSAAAASAADGLYYESYDIRMGDMQASLLRRRRRAPLQRAAHRGALPAEHALSEAPAAAQPPAAARRRRRRRRGPPAAAPPRHGGRLARVRAAALGAAVPPPPRPRGHAQRAARAAHAAARPATRTRRRRRRFRATSTPPDFSPLGGASPLGGGSATGRSGGTTPLRRAHSSAAILSHHIYRAAAKVLRAHAANADLVASLAVPHATFEMRYRPHGAARAGGARRGVRRRPAAELLTRPDQVAVDGRLRALRVRDLTDAAAPHVATTDAAPPRARRRLVGGRHGAARRRRRRRARRLLCPASEAAPRRAGASPPAAPPPRVGGAVLRHAQGAPEPRPAAATAVAGAAPLRAALRRGHAAVVPRAGGQQPADGRRAARRERLLRCRRRPRGGAASDGRQWRPHAHAGAGRDDALAAARR